MSAALLSPFATAQGLLGHQPCKAALGKGLCILSAQPQLRKGPLSQSSASDVCQHVAVVHVTQGTGKVCRQIGLCSSLFTVV